MGKLNLKPEYRLWDCGGQLLELKMEVKSDKVADEGPHQKGTKIRKIPKQTLILASDSLFHHMSHVLQFRFFFCYNTCLNLVVSHLSKERAHHSLTIVILWELFLWAWL